MSVVRRRIFYLWRTQQPPPGTGRLCNSLNFVAGGCGSRAFSQTLSRFRTCDILKFKKVNYDHYSTAPLMKMAPEVASSTKKQMVLKDNVAVIRFQPGDERFQMQLTLNSGKTFNFDRKCTDSLSNVVTRIVTSLTKKVKNFQGLVRFVGVDKVSAENGAIDDEEEIGKILERNCILDSSMMLQVDEEFYDVIFNPPEVHVVKFFGTYMPTLPLFPYRLECSANFCKERSIYSWKFSREKPSPVVPPKLRKKFKDIDNVPKGRGNDTWKEVEGGSDLVFTPTPEMVGGYLQFSCIPSNGKILGKPFVLSLPKEVQPLPVDRFLYQERLKLLREKPEADPNFLRVLSYNVLADTYATAEWFVSSPPESLDVGYRLPILNQEILSYRADLICLQEVDEKYFEGNFQPFLEMHGYKGSHTSKTGNTKEGIATFWEPQKLERLEFHECVILEHMKTLPFWKKLTAVSKDFEERLQERNTVFQVSLFSRNSAENIKTLMLLGNVHLYFHPDADHIRLLQTITCLNFLETKFQQVSAKYPDHKITVMYCGDLNCTPPFSSYRLLTTGSVQESDEDWTSHSEEKISPGIPFKHNFNFTNSHPGEELTNITTCFEGCLDYILFQTEHLQLIGNCPVPSKETLASIMKFDEPRKVSLPNFYTPSDHLPIIADFRFK